MDPVALIDHQYTVAAYAITWIIQLGYVAWPRTVPPALPHPRTTIDPALK